MIIIDKDYRNKLQLNVAISLGLLLLIVGANYLGDIMGCRIRKLLNTNIFAKHIMGIFCLFFFVTLLLPLEYEDEKGEIVREPLKITVGRTLFIYIIYLMIARTPIYVSLLIYLLLFTIYVLSLYEKDYHKKYNKDIRSYQEIIGVITSAILIVGFMFYGIKKYYKYEIIENTGFNMITFFFGKINCNF